MLDPQKIKNDFPILQRKIHGRKLVYLDNAATSQKPQVVIDAISEFYSTANANVHRGVHTLADESTHLLQESREKIARFFGASNQELILVRNTTEAINGVAYGWALDSVGEGDVILTTIMEHHSNIVPWQEVCQRVGARLEFIPVTKAGRLDLAWLRRKMKDERWRVKLKLVALAHVSNALGTINPVAEIVNLIKSTIHNSQCRILIDGAQAAPHMKIDFHRLGVDFYAFSGHKMLGPMGIGGLLVRKEILENGKMKPWFFGGGMIRSVAVDKTEFAADLIDKFTPGTPDVASAVGLAAAGEYLSSLGMSAVEAHDRELVNYALERLGEIEGVRIVGPVIKNERIKIKDEDKDKRRKTKLETNFKRNSNIKVQSSKVLDRIGSVAFLFDDIHPHDVAQVLDSEGIAVRSGHHCCMPLHEQFNWPGTIRASFNVYNTQEDIDRLVEGLEKVREVFRV